jgi:hypothetical protein
VAPLTLEEDERGAVYVEFLLAFLPIFLLFLAICQVAFLVAGKLVVSHAALAAARSAIVVLEDDPKHYSNAERGWLSDKPAAKPKEDDVFAALSNVMSGKPVSTPLPPTGPKKPPQQGARMQAIRTTALRALSAIAPTAGTFLGGAGGTLKASLETDGSTAQAFGRVYVEGAAVVTVHDGPNEEGLANEPIGRTAPVTVRVTFLQMCAIPVVRTMMCRSLADLLDRPTPEHGTPAKAGTPTKAVALRVRMAHAGLPKWLETSAAPDARFVVWEAQMTLPNQGAAYDYAEHGEETDAQTSSL